MRKMTLEMRSVTKKYAAVAEVTNLTIHVSAGEIYGLIGPDGSGKTTVLSLAAGVYAPTRGSVRVGGINMVDSPSRVKRLIGYVPDEPLAYDRLSGREFLEFVGQLYGMDRALRDRAVASLIERYDLGAVQDGFFAGYARGVKQMFALAAAFVHDPALIVADEPTLRLDPTARRITADLFRAFAGRGGAALLATNDLQLAEKICHRIGVLRGGVLVAEGTPAKLVKKSGLIRGGLEDAYPRLLDV